MATFKPVVLKGQTNVKGESNIKILIVHNRHTAYIKTPYYTHPSFVLKSGKISNKYENYNELNAELKQFVSALNLKLIQLGTSIYEFSVQELKKYLLESNKIVPSEEKLLFFPMAYTYIEQLRMDNKRTWKIYNDSLKQIEKFSPKLEINKISVEFLKDFEHYQLTKENPIELNSITVYINALSAVYHHLVKVNYLLKNLEDPFKDYKKRHNMPRERVFTLQELKQIKNYKPTLEKEVVAKDICMLIFYLIGINVVDLFWAKSLNYGRLSYIRSKTESNNYREYSIKIESEAQEILDKYKGNKYLLRFADYNYKERIEPRVKYQRFLWQYYDHKKFNTFLNDNLKNICTALKFPFAREVGTYWFRHTWATIAWKDCEIPEHVVSICLGHDTVNRITGLYIGQRNDVVDRANRKVLNKIKSL